MCHRYQRLCLEGLHALSDVMIHGGQKFWQQRVKAMLLRMEARLCKSRVGCLFLGSCVRALEVSCSSLLLFVVSSSRDILFTHRLGLRACFHFISSLIGSWCSLADEEFASFLALQTQLRHESGNFVSRHCAYFSTRTTRAFISCILV